MIKNGLLTLLITTSLSSFAGFTFNCPQKIDIKISCKNYYSPDVINRPYIKEYSSRVEYINSSSYDNGNKSCQYDIDSSTEQIIVAYKNAQHIVRNREELRDHLYSFPAFENITAFELIEGIQTSNSGKFWLKYFRKSFSTKRFASIELLRFMNIFETNSQRQVEIEDELEGGVTIDVAGFNLKTGVTPGVSQPGRMSTSGYSGISISGACTMSLTNPDL